MTLVQKASRYTCIFALFAVILCGEAAYSANNSWGQQFQDEWREWCSATKQELNDAHVFDSKAEYPGIEIDADGVAFISFESLRIPYVVGENPEIAIKHVRDGATSLRVSYESGLKIVVGPMMLDPIRNVFKRLVPELTEEIEAYVVEKYGSLEGFTASHFRGNPDLVHLRFEGYEFTTDDIDCTLANVDETLRKIALIVASASADYVATQAGDDVAYWSKNGLPGVVTKQQTRFSRGSEGPRVIWSGEFIDNDNIWQVIISFGVEAQDQYDRLGILLANPRLK